MNNMPDELPPGYQEAPLESLCSKPAHLMSPDERRDMITRIRNMRNNHHQWKQFIAGEPTAPTKIESTFDEFNV